MSAIYIQSKETDLPKLRSLARIFLSLEIKPTDFSPLVVKHPFTDCGIVGLRDDAGVIRTVDLLEDTDALCQWRERWEQQIDKEDDPFRLFGMITKPYKLSFLKYAAPDLSKQDRARFLADAWILSENPNEDPNLSQRDLLTLFRRVDPQDLMSEEEYAQLQELEDVVTIYRGVTPYNAHRVKALSWTLDRDVAQWFAHRYGEAGSVYEAKIEKRHIYALFTARNESEVIVNPKGLMELTQLPEQTQEAEYGSVDEVSGPESHEVGPTMG